VPTALVKIEEIRLYLRRCLRSCRKVSQSSFLLGWGEVVVEAGLVLLPVVVVVVEVEVETLRCVCRRIVVAGGKGVEVRSVVKRKGEYFGSIAIWCCVLW